jgi:hypothetical protein
MSLPNIIVEGNFGALQSDTYNIDKFAPFALKYYDSVINAHFELKQDLSFTWYQKRNMTAKLLKQKPVDTGLSDQYVNVEGLGFEQEQTAILSHDWQNQITDADYPSQANVSAATGWTEISAGEDFEINTLDHWNGWPAGVRVKLLIVNFNATNNIIIIKLYPTLKEFTILLEQGKAIGFYFVKGTNDVEKVLVVKVFSSGFKYKLLHHNQNPNIKIFNVKFQEFKDTNIPPSDPASLETSGFEGAIYLFNLTSF